MIGILVASTVVLGVITSISTGVFNKGFDNIEADRNIQELNTTFEQIRHLVNGVESCTALMTAQQINYDTANPMPIASIDTGSGIVAAGSSGDLTIQSINLIHESTLPQVYDSAGVLQNHHRAHIELVGSIIFNKRTRNFAKSFALDVVLDSTNQIVKCYRGQEPKLIACQVMNGVYNPSLGSCTLPINGPVRGHCPSGQCVYGFNEQNEILCRTM